MAPNVSTKLAQLPAEAEQTEEGQPKEAKEETQPENEIKLDEQEIKEEMAGFMEFKAEVEAEALAELQAEAEADAEAEQEEQEEDEEELTHIWNNAEINAHSTLLTDRCTRVDTFYAWLSIKK